ncbi:MAG: hypothetical protein A3J30_04130 [Candidatus Wildermuthbacteria bacterium RIFCSPLOWO2_02_FULL_47_9c]|uniref:Prenyltransferase/squalene oxidase n=2 Tax=Parcubacteria group TaxID=1794811 RepID=A0A837ISB6_9BACT|nr:MAG: Prenyltransferase/squalene oxidase [Candidatus Yanofskybacteria bacterium GW2011_GWC1_48_11]KKW04470.1 MAG: Prenyltransferase/squalene oxidase [Parcubacteria group bacterium GW2011_GWB1_49_12]KKW08600.1 MAG: Prenyltransferase/squalene oxidase [Parcubacteria group bacterium GW2011_GWA1_49_26]KKW14088.1 MAG: Prenyltransferase/squalene oxidase [Parcubacteria group bacterium GW2011_GWA2_50_10]OHA61578.1 MAG: hypothetical protein A2109_03565 [Candidatus Wildermuthbacteria bacterium GWA1_49_2
MKKQTNLRKRFFVCTCTAIFVLLLSSGGAYAEESVCEPNSIEINTASKEDLKLLPGVGPTIAERIIEGRPFGSVDDLISVSGIGQKRLQDIKEQGCAWVNVELLEEDEEEVVEEGQEELEEEEQENQEEEGVGESEEEGEGIQDDESDDANEDEDSEEAGGSGGNGSGGSGGSDPAPVVDINVVLVKAVAFLQNQELSPDIVMAFIAVGQSADISFLKTFFGDSAISYAKPILAITATGQDPRTFPEEDFVEKLKSFTDDTQLGDPSLLNDDIWGILALRSAGVPASDPVIQNSKAFLLQDQNADGGWAWDAGGTSDTNDTAAAIMALLETGMTETDNAIQLARQYLKEAQNLDGGFPYDPQSPFGTDSDGNSDAWVIMAIHKLGEDPTAWTKSPENPIEHLLSLQDEDGGFWWVAPGTSEWNNKGATPDAVIALSGKSFPVYSISVFQDQESAQEQTESTVGSNMSNVSSSPQMVGEEEIFTEGQREGASRQELLREIQAELLRVEEEAREIERQLASLAAQQAQDELARAGGQIQEALAQETEEQGENEPARAGGQTEFAASLVVGVEETRSQALRAEVAAGLPAQAGANTLGFIRSNMLLLFAAALIFGFGIYRFLRFSR